MNAQAGRRDRGERRWQQKHDAAKRRYLKALLTLWSQHGAPSDIELAETTGTLDESRVAHCLDGGWAGESEIAAIVAGIVKYPLTQRPIVSAKTVLKPHRALAKVGIYGSGGSLGGGELFAEIAAYLGSAGLGGFIGNRPAVSGHPEPHVHRRRRGLRGPRENASARRVADVFGRAKQPPGRPK